MHTRAAARVTPKMVLAVSAYLVVQALHVMAVIAAYGLPLAYPLLIPYVRRNHPHAMPGLHDVQHRLNRLLTGPGTAVILFAGIYMATEGDAWDEPWVHVGLAAILVIGAVGGGVVVPASRRMAELARVDVDAAPAGGAVAWSAEYDRVYGRYMAAEVFLGAVVLLAVFFMTVKPFG